MLGLAAFWTTIVHVTYLSLDDTRYSSALVVPCIAIILVYVRRREIFLNVRYSPKVGFPFLAFGFSLHWLAELRRDLVSQDARLSVAVFALVIVGVASFVLCYGSEAFRQARFPLLFLAFMIPLPPAVLDKAVAGLQQASAETSYVLFKLLGVPVFPQGVKLSLPGADIEISRDCSGIHSCLSLVITSVIAGYVFLRSGYSRVWFVALTIPITIFKNAVRIVAISWLGIHVSSGFLSGKLHWYTGLAFSGLALALMLAVAYVLRCWDARWRKRYTGNLVMHSPTNMLSEGTMRPRGPQGRSVTVGVSAARPGGR